MNGWGTAARTHRPAADTSKKHKERPETATRPLEGPPETATRPPEGPPETATGPLEGAPETAT